MNVLLRIYETCNVLRSLRWSPTFSACCHVVAFCVGGRHHESGWITITNEKYAQCKAKVLFRCENVYSIITTMGTTCDARICDAGVLCCQKKTPNGLCWAGAE